MLQPNDITSLLDLKTNPALALDGPNFSGRTALLRAASGLSISDDDMDYQPDHARPMAYIGPDIASAISGLASTVHAEIRLHAAMKVEDSPAASIASRLGLERLYDRNPFTLSGGEQACLALTSAFALDPEIMALDCPLEQLDVRMKPLVVEMLSKDLVSRGASVLLADNRLEECQAPFRTIEMSSLDIPKETIHGPAFEPINPDIEIPPPHTTSGAIGMENLSFAYVRDCDILKNFTMSLEPGRLYYMLGYNGAGKSTFAKILAGVIRQKSGVITLDGSPFLPYRAPGKVVAYHFQNPDLQLFSTTVYDEVTGGAQRRGKEAQARAEAIMAAFGLVSVRDEHPLDLPFVIRKRIALAATIASGAQWVILDEPTLGQDYTSSQAIGKIIERLLATGIGVIVITHSTTFRKILPAEEYSIQSGNLIRVQS